MTIGGTVIVGRIDQYASVLTDEFDEVTQSTMSITGFGTYYSSEFTENVGITTNLIANTFRPYDLVGDEFGGTLFGVGNGTIMRQNSDNTVIGYNDFDEVTPITGSNTGIVKNGLLFHVDAANTYSYSGIGSSWYDITPNKRENILVGSPTFNSNFGGGLVFAGALTQGVDIPSHIFNPAYSFNQFSICAVVNLTSSTGGTKTIFDYRDATSDGIILFIAAATPQLNIQSTGISFNQTIPTGTPTFLDATYDGKTFNCYVNSNLVRTGITTQKCNVTTLPKIAIRNFSTAANAFQGTIYSVKVYNRALSSVEVKQNYEVLNTRY